MWPEGNVIIRRGVIDASGGVPDYNALVRVERESSKTTAACSTQLQPS
jgi:hypothetical protein